MKSNLLLLGAAAMALMPSLAAAGPPQPSNTQTNTQTPVAQGQPNQSCQDVNGGNTGPYYPGHTSTAPGSAFNETNGIAGGMYAGSQPQNSNNPASVSQYDVACFNQLAH
jgi:hypothetical protein